ncbi:hypothetical protein PUN28_009580 [Cardiocondyla obscurior]|uniref:Uncharacterized protein n=1 Tax=Cardiocondyla obscurior TaxID=286306 RepID=A0AAW2FWF1_9HYME
MNNSSVIVVTSPHMKRACPAPGSSTVSSWSLGQRDKVASCSSSLLMRTKPIINARLCGTLIKIRNTMMQKMCSRKVLDYLFDDSKTHERHLRGQEESIDVTATGGSQCRSPTRPTKNAYQTCPLNLFEVMK